MNRVCSDTEFSGALKSKLFSLTINQKKRSRMLAKNSPTWQRPNAEDSAKGLGMHFLYHFGYDYGSTHVHPMANDGDQDFYTITKLELAPDLPDCRSVLSNTLFVATLLVQQGLNASTLSWRALVYNFFNDLRRSLDKGAEDYEINFVKIRIIFEQGIKLCEPQKGFNGERGRCNGE